MKKIFMTLFAVVLTLGLATSCTKTEKKILGTWEASTAVMIQGEGELEVVGTVWTFKDDNTLTVNDGSSTVTGTYTINKEHMTMTFNITEEGITVNNVMDMDITEITKSNMTLEGTMKYSYQGTLMDSCTIRVSFKKK